MSTHKPTPAPERISVPREPPLDRAETTSPPTPSPETVNVRDEEYPSSEHALPAGSPAAKRLHKHPPGGEDQLRTGSGGDAARPGKTGIMNPSLPPRGDVRTSR